MFYHCEDNYIALLMLGNCSILYFQFSPKNLQANICRILCIYFVGSKKLPKNTQKNLFYLETKLTSQSIAKLAEKLLRQDFWKHSYSIILFLCSSSVRQSVMLCLSFDLEWKKFTFQHYYSFIYQLCYFKMLPFESASFVYMF